VVYASLTLLGEEVADRLRRRLLASPARGKSAPQPTGLAPSLS